MISEIIPREVYIHVIFPFMDPKTIINSVYYVNKEFNGMSKDQILWRYICEREDSRVSDEKDLESMVNESYEGKKCKWTCYYFENIHAWKWDKTRTHEILVIHDKENVLEHPNYPCWGTGFVKRCFSSGVSCWEIEIVNVTSNISIGVGRGIGYKNSFVEGKDSWCYYCGSQIFEKSEDVTHNVLKTQGKTFKRRGFIKGDIIGCRLDLREEGTLSYFLNGGYVFKFTRMKELLQKFYIAVTLYNKCETVKLRVGISMIYGKEYKEYVAN